MSGFGGPTQAPAWVTHGLVPLINLGVALLIAGVIIALIGENPFEALRLLVRGAVGYPEAIGYTLYYTTNFVFTGLAVAIAFHCGLFNIGGEGQAYLGGLGAGLIGLYLGHWPAPVAILLAIAVAMAFGAFWGFIPGWLQAKRGSHIVITTIMFNFLAAALMTYLLVEVFIKPGQQAAESRTFESGAWLPFVHDIAAALGADIGRSSLNLSVVIAGVCLVLFWFFVWRTRWGYEIRAVGHNEAAAVYGGISAGALHHAGDGGLGRARRPRRRQRDRRRPPPAAARVHGGLRLRRHRGGADGAQTTRSASCSPPSSSACSIRAAPRSPSTCPT